MSNNLSDVEQYFSPALCRAARGLLGWSQGELADKARVGRSTVADFERGSRIPVRNNLLALVQALQGAGVMFVPSNGAGCGVRFMARE